MTTNTAPVTFRLLLSVLSILLTLTGCQSEEKKALDYLQSAQEYYDNNEYSLASVELKNAIKKDSSLADAYVLQARIFKSRRQWELMGSFLLSAMQHQTKHIEANVMMAELYLMGQLPNKAQEHLDIAIEAGVDKLTELLILTSIYSQQNKLDEATTTVKEAIKLAPLSIEANIKLAHIEVLKNNFDLALEHIKEANDKLPYTEEIYLLKAKILTLKSDFPAAISTLEELLTFSTKTLDNYYLLSMLFDRTGDQEKAEQTLRLAAEKNPEKQDAKIALASYINNREDQLRAINLLETYTNKEEAENTTAIRLFLADLYQEQENFQQAAHIYSQLADSNNSIAKSQLAMMEFKNGDSESALNRLNIILSNEFNNTEALMSRSIIYLSMKDTDKAITDLLNILRESPNSEIALLFTAQAYHQIRDFDQSLIYLQKLIKLNPLNEKALILYGNNVYKDNHDIINTHEYYIREVGDSRTIEEQLINTYLIKKMWAKASDLADKLAAKHSLPQYKPYIQSLVDQGQGRHKESIEISKKLIEDNTYISASLKNIISNYRALNSPVKGIKYLEKYTSQHPDDLYAIQLLASEQNSPASAEKILKETLQSNPEWYLGYLQLAKIYASQGNWNSAINSGLKASPENHLKDSFELSLLLASSYEKANDPFNAIKYYQKSLTLRPTMDAIINNLALLLANHGDQPQNLSEAYNLAKHFEASNHPPYLDTLGWIYYLQEKYQLAAATLEKAIFQAPKATYIHYHLGATLFKLKEMERSRTHLKYAINNINTSISIEDIDNAKRMLEMISEPANNQAN
jgi:tetratricopeptide (TPR) repeat protein